MAPLRAGALRSRVTLQSPSRAANGSGGYTTTWTDAATVWGNVRQIAGAGDAETGEQTASLRRYEIAIRKRSAVTTAMRVVRGSQTLEVRVVREDDAAPDQLVLEAVEVTPGSAA